MRPIHLLLVGLAYSSSFANSPDPELVVFNQGWFPSAQFAGIYVALDEGLYAEAGLEVSITPFAYGRDSTADLSRDPEVCTVGSIEGYILLQKLDRGDDLIALSPMLRESPAGAMSLVEASIKSPADFANRPIGVHAYADALFKWFAHRAGVTEAQLQIVRVEDDLTPLLSGQVVAMQGYASEEYVRLQRAAAPAPTQFLSFAAMGFPSYSEILYTTRTQVADHATTLARFVAATREGWHRAFAAPELAVAAVARQIGSSAERDHIAAALTALRPFVLDDSGHAMPAMRTEKWRSLQTASKEMGLIKNSPPNPESWLWSDPALATSRRP